ncbi:GRIP and coiled-coil domain-containing protein 2 [Stomoxys calcitrans]|uniref:GRIP and coiled-coil domain-containing protein 2 n=1 Tax=Stomoxys calcitrans TaxID=35570 RepID=UPI0027E21AC4|nr:GRIP and coiled-coil domain-containing protein 2 [Stomoxys calcitrans]
MDQTQGQKVSLEALSKEEIISKYKGLLGIAKKAKQAKDEISEENRKLKEQLQQCETQKEADKNALLTMKEMLEAYTEHKLQLSTQISDLEKRRKLEGEQLDKLSIENESLKRQISRLTQDNDSLLTDIENMEGQLKQVSGLGKEQKHHLVLLEQEINELRQAEGRNQELLIKNADLTKSLEELKEKYVFIKEINTEQRQKFNSLKDRFIEVHKKLKKLKECKRILLETQHEYADSVTQWQMEIIKASKLLCKELDGLREENMQLLKRLGQSSHRPLEPFIEKINNLLSILEKIKIDYHHLKSENFELRKQMSSSKTMAPKGLHITEEKLKEMLKLSQLAQKEYRQTMERKCPNCDSGDTNSQALSPCLITKLELLQDLANNAEKEYRDQSEELRKLRNDYDNLKNKTWMENSSEILTRADQKLNEVQKENVFLREEIKMNATKIESLDALEADFKKLSLENSRLRNQLEENKIPSQQEIKEVTNLRDQLDKLQKSSEDYQEMFTRKEREHYELLDEMRELNEALKARGDLISRQQEEQLLLKTELQNSVEKWQILQKEVEHKDQVLLEKTQTLDVLKKNLEETKEKLAKLETASSLNEEKIRILSNEIEILRHAQSNAAPDLDNQSDILSTSTISRADELQRLKEVEDSFEDKYNKLRGLATKLKKKLQEEVAHKQDLEKELHELRNREGETKSKISYLQNTIVEMESLKSQVSEKQKQIDSLKNENQKLKSSRKQANVLNLEIEAAEKSLTEVTNKLAARTSELDSAQEIIKTKDVTIVQLRKEIELLESSKTAETNHSQQLKDQIDHLQKTLKDSVHSKQQALDKTKILEQDLENLKLELESARLEISNEKSNLEKTLIALKSEKQNLFIQLSSAQHSLAECEQKLKYAERATEDIRIEYLDYKVKAQAVLRKNQNRDSTKERELEEELLALRATETQLKATIDSLSTKLQILEKDKELMADDNNQAKKRSQELMQLIENLREQNETLNQEMQQQQQQQHETLKQQRQQLETMDVCHKDQINSLNANHQRQLEQIQKELSFNNNPRLPTMVGASKSTSSSHFADHQSKIDYILMEREDAEGSEEAAENLATLAASRKISNASSSIAKRSHDFMPLDELLNTPINAITSETLITTPMHNTADNLNNMDMLQLELNSTKERLQKQESRVRHLTALLAENEQDLAKLTQMNDMLKEELRRQERSVEREQHLHNSEYVKNVIMKFLTLNNADEKTRLVPVLNTILKLSRPETEILNCVAKGQKVSEATQRGGGWGNFLPWGGGGGGNSNN